MQIRDLEQVMGSRTGRVGQWVVEWLQELAREWDGELAMARAGELATGRVAELVTEGDWELAPERGEGLR